MLLATMAVPVHARMAVDRALRVGPVIIARRYTYRSIGPASRKARYGYSALTVRFS